MKPISEKPDYMRWWDLPAALLLLASLITAATRLTATRWTEHLSLVQTLTLLGTILGLALGQSRFSPFVARFLAFGYGLCLIPWQLGLTVGDNLEWLDRLALIGNRLLITIDQVIRQKPVSDNLFFLTLMSLLFWTLSVYAGYSLTRHAHPWRAILPIGLALIVIHTYDSFFNIRTWFLAGYLFFALLLVARLHFLNRHSRWKQTGAYLPPYLDLDFIRFALLVTSVIVLLAWTAPALATAVSPAEQVWRRAISPWNAVRERLSTAFSALQSSVGFVSDFYGDTLSLGRGNPLTDTVVMTVQSPPLVAAGVRYYWRARVYDFYDGAWTSTLPSTEELSPENFADLEIPDLEGRTTASFTFKSNYPIQILYTPSQPLWVDRKVEALLAHNTDGTQDIGLLKAVPYLGAQGTYQVEASLSSASVSQLREAGTEYPRWVTERYLQLPDTITPRTRELAAQIAATLDNPYDITQSITAFLRGSLEYSETIPSVPRGREPIDWILFDHQQAFCNYYASAEIVMLRSLGIPARLSVGYAQGEQTSLEEPGLVPTLGAGGENIPQEIGALGDLYTVRHRDAHAWPEVYFPGLGWVEFEPTASQLPLFRPQGITSLENTPDPVPAESDAAQRNLDQLREELLSRGSQPLGGSILGQRLNIPWGVWVLFAVLLIVLAYLVTSRIRRRRGSPPIPVQLEAGLRQVGLQPPSILQRWVYFAMLSPLSRAYLELNRALSRLGSPPHPTDTPAERAARLCQLLPETTPEIQYLLAEYQAATYSLQPGDAQTARQVGIEIRKRSYLALLQRLLARLQEPAGRKRPLYPRAP